MARRYYMIRAGDSCPVIIYDSCTADINGEIFYDAVQLGEAPWFVFSIDANGGVPPEGSISLDLIIRMIEYQDYKRKKRGHRVMDARAMLRSLTGY